MRRLHEKKIDDAEYYESIWDEETNSRPYYDAVRIRALLSPAKVGDRVLDVGAGVYGAARYAAEHCPELRLKLHAVDQSYTARNLVVRDFPGIDYRLCDVMSLPFDDDSFDLVIAGEVIEHIEDPASFSKELVRVARPGGYVTISTVDTNSEGAIAHGDYPEHLWEFSPGDLVGFFDSAEHSFVGDYHFVKATA